MGKDFGDGFLERALTLMGSGLENEFVAIALETDILEERNVICELFQWFEPWDHLRQCLE